MMAQQTLLNRVFYAGVFVALLVATAILLNSYIRNAELLENSTLAFQKYLADAGPLVDETLIGDHDLHRVLPYLQELRDMPFGYAARDAPTPLALQFGLSQRQHLHTVSERAYGAALETMLRPRLLFRLEEVLDAKAMDSGFSYEALKVYLMLGGLHPADRELIRSWMRRDWAENLYPGPSNAEGRKLLEDHLEAMLDLESGTPRIELNGRLIDESQKALAVLSTSRRGYKLLKSKARSSPAGDWIAAQKGGPDATLVFEVPGDLGGLQSVRVPEFFTKLGFQRDFIDRLPDIVDGVKRDRWMLGAAGEKLALPDQYDDLPDDLLALYTQDFISTWQAALAKLQLRKMTRDKPQYIALSVISAPTSPLAQLLESIAAETMVTRRSSAAAPSAGIPAIILFKSQDRVPGADIEAAFKPYHVVVEGPPGRRPIDDVIGTLNEITQSSILAATTPSQAQRALPTLHNSVAKLRNSAARFPTPFSNMLLALSAEVESSIAGSTAGQLQHMISELITPFCVQAISDRYPFARYSNNDVSLPDFAKLFGPEGVMDNFVKQYLDEHVDRSKLPWTWRQNSELARLLPLDVLLPFQQASEVRDAFFQVGGNVPNVQLTVKPPVVSDGVVRLEVGGNTIVSPVVQHRASNVPSSFLLQWPGASFRAAISVSGAKSTEPYVLERNGLWSMFRLFEAGGLSVHDETATVFYAIGGRELRYEFTSAAARNPLALEQLRRFHCPGAS